MLLVGKEFTGNLSFTETPLPLSSCRLANITASSLSLTCQRPDVDAAGTTIYRAEVCVGEGEVGGGGIVFSRKKFVWTNASFLSLYMLKAVGNHCLKLHSSSKDADFIF